MVYPGRLRDLLIRLAIAGLYQEQLARTRRLMTTALPDAVVSAYQALAEQQDLPDADHRHVLAAAVTANAS